MLITSFETNINYSSDMSARFRKGEGGVIELLTDSMGPEIETSQGTTKVEKRPAVANHVLESARLSVYPVKTRLIGQ